MKNIFNTSWFKTKELKLEKRLLRNVYGIVLKVQSQQDLTRQELNELLDWTPISPADAADRKKAYPVLAFERDNADQQIICQIEDISKTTEDDFLTLKKNIRACIKTHTPTPPKDTRTLCMN